MTVPGVPVRRRRIGWMGTLATLLLLGIGVAVSPVAVIASILLIVPPGGRAKGAAFVAGWVGGLAVVGVVVTGLEGALGVGGDGPDWIGPAVSLAVGLLLLAYGVLRWMRRPAPGDDDPTPGWMGALASAGPGRAASTGMLFAAVKPKNLGLTLAAATAIAEADLAVAGTAGALVVYLAVASASVATPLVVSLALGARAAQVLDGWSASLTRNNAAIMAVVLVAFGALLTFKGVSGLV